MEPSWSKAATKLLRTLTIIQGTLFLSKSFLFLFFSEITESNLIPPVVYASHLGGGHFLRYLNSHNLSLVQIMFFLKDLSVNVKC